MRITGIRVWRVELPLHEGRYSWSNDNFVEVFDSTVVAIDTDAGLTGWGEVCPLGAAYLPAYANGARAGIQEIGPALIGLDPRELTQLNLVMDQTLKGHPYVKSALDMACWDLLGKASALPVTTLLGGRFGADFALYRAISQDEPEAMAAKTAATGPRATASSSSRSAARSRPTSPASGPARPCSNPATCWWPTPTPAGPCTRRPGCATRCATSTSTSSSLAPPTRPA